jgi:hypothetical protein
MGRLAGFSWEVAHRLRTFGFQFDRPGAGSHEVWAIPKRGERSRFRTIPETWPKARCAILREAGINVSDFLKAELQQWSLRGLLRLFLLGRRILARRLLPLLHLLLLLCVALLHLLGLLLVALFDLLPSCFIGILLR